MKGTGLWVENFPPDLKREARITALRLGVSLRQFVIDAIAAQVAASGPPEGARPEGGGRP